MIGSVALEDVGKAAGANNGQLAFGNYRWDEERATFEARSISVLTLAREGIAEITTFIGPELTALFGLPDRSSPSRAMDFGHPTYPY